MNHDKISPSTTAAAPDRSRFPTPLSGSEWMCEQIVIDGGRIGRQRLVGTHLSVAEHQAHTVTNYLQLRTLAPDLPIVPVLQGQTRDAYLPGLPLGGRPCRTRACWRSALADCRS
jgi:hypothetical protein